MPKIYPGISCNLDSNVLATTLPLFEDSAVEAIEWSFDALFRHEHIPDWFLELIDLFGKNGRLIGHGVYYSLFSGKWKQEQQKWLDHLGQTVDQFSFDHISEHFGFMTGADFHKGAPLPVPYSSDTLRIAKDRIARLYDACHCPVGLENLAFSYCSEEVEQHGSFIKEILADVNGFIILDLHNLYCQVENFNISFDEIIAMYPLELVREIHISGGSWEDSMVETGRRIRRDTHDNGVPEEVLEYLKVILPKLPNVKFVILEQLGTALKTEVSRDQFRNDYYKMKDICESAKLSSDSAFNSFLSSDFKSPGIPFESKELADQQMALTNIFEHSKNLHQVKESLLKSKLNNSAWKIERWEDAMLETAFAIAQKWKDGF